MASGYPPQPATQVSDQTRKPEQCFVADAGPAASRDSLFPSTHKYKDKKLLGMSR